MQTLCSAPTLLTNPDVGGWIRFRMLRSIRPPGLSFALLAAVGVACDISAWRGGVLLLRIILAAIWIYVCVYIYVIYIYISCVCVSHSFALFAAVGVACSISVWRGGVLLF